MENQLLKIKQIIEELTLQDGRDDYFSLPEKLEEEFQHVQDNLL
jgi:hypothetical protein